MVGGRGLEVLAHLSVAMESSYITEPNLNNFSACCGVYFVKASVDVIESETWVWEEEEAANSQEMINSY